MKCVQLMLTEAQQAAELPDAAIDFYPQWLAPPAAAQSYERLYQQICWRQDVIRIFGKEILLPRLQAWYGEKAYSYSGMKIPAIALLPEMKVLKQRISALSGFEFNSVLANLYRNGQDSVGWHADDEPEIVNNACIASLSLGAARRFELKHRFRKDIPPVSFVLESGSLLLMHGTTQQYWLHQLPKMRSVQSPRINLTFRLMH
jgi:alkylated DNA repair dioxygenase AlkB